MRHVHDPERILDLNRRFHDEVEAETYDQRMGVDHGDDAVAAMIEELERVLGEPLPRGEVLDVGAGTGNVAVKLARTGRFDRVVAADISRGMLRVAREAAEALGLDNLETVETDMRALPFPDDSFDAVVGCAFLHHLPDPVRFVREVHRVLRPGAPFVFIGEPSTRGARLTGMVKAPLVATNRVLERVTGRRGLRWDHDDIDVHTFTVDDIHRMAADFERVRLAPAGFLEPIIDQGLLAPARLVFRHPRLGRAMDRTQLALRWMDLWCNERLPPSWLVSMKFAGYKPA